MNQPEEREPEEIVADLEHSGEKVAGNIDETRADWEAKQADESIPGAQPPPESGEEPQEEAPEGDSKDDHAEAEEPETGD